MAFVGDSGTGKTELAMRIVPFLDAIGVTDGTNKFCKVGEADLIAKYVGHTAPKVRMAVEQALGGVLFIDEFYAIANAPRFGREAIDTLVDQIETHRNDFVCIIAGYTNKVDKALDLNPGLRGRFGFRIEFPDYTDEELGDIFVNMADKRGFEVEDRNILARCTAKLRSTRTFANARTMRNLVDKAIIEASNSHEGSQICGDDLLAATNELYERRGAVGF
jgi:AAA+ superfamily predicted ATPase